MVGHVRWDGLRTWYRTVGTGGSRVPVVICHGGPGATHDYVTPIADLAERGHPCVLYDQVGNGHSQRLPEAPAPFWTVDLFLRELDALVEHLGWGEAYHVVGQSWGGMLAFEHALRHPPGLRSIVAADSPASIPLWVAEADRLRAELPPEVDAVLRAHEEAGTTSDPAYQAAMQEFYRRHVCRLDPWPEELVRSFAAMEEDPTVHGTMNGPSEFHCVGTLRDWDITDRLGEIDVPTLLISGRYDEATPAVIAPIHAGIAGSEWVVLEESSHTPHMEEPERFLDVVEGFLARVEAATAARA